MEQVILVDEQDNEIGTMEKMEAHRKGILHRAFSVVLFNVNGEILLQKRSLKKYHSGGLWTNTCCSHPRPDESMDEAVRRRLHEEMGIDIQPEYAYKFLYQVRLQNDLIEHELDHVYIGTFSGEPVVNAQEVDTWKFVNRQTLRTDMINHPEKFTHWFKLIMNDPQFESIQV